MLAPVENKNYNLPLQKLWETEHLIYSCKNFKRLMI